MSTGESTNDAVEVRETAQGVVVAIESPVPVALAYSLFGAYLASLVVWWEWGGGGWVWAGLLAMLAVVQCCLPKRSGLYLTDDRLTLRDQGENAASVPWSSVEAVQVVMAAWPRWMIAAGGARRWLVFARPARLDVRVAEGRLRLRTPWTADTWSAALDEMVARHGVRVEPTLTAREANRTLAPDQRIGLPTRPAPGYYASLGVAALLFAGVALVVVWQSWPPSASAVAKATLVGLPFVYVVAAMAGVALLARRNAALRSAFGAYLL